MITFAMSIPFAIFFVRLNIVTVVKSEYGGYRVIMEAYASNPLFDALCYLSMRANGGNLQAIIGELTHRYTADRECVLSYAEPYLHFEKLLSKAVNPVSDKLHAFFDRFGEENDPLLHWGNIAGSIYGNIAASKQYSHIGDAEKAVSALTEPQKRRNILNAMYSPFQYIEDIYSEDAFFSALDVLSVPQEIKWKLNSAYHRYNEYAEELSGIIAPVMELIKENFIPENGFAFEAFDKDLAIRRVKDKAHEAMPDVTFTDDMVRIYPSCMLMHRMNIHIEMDDAIRPIYVTAHIGLLGFALDRIPKHEAPSSFLVPSLKSIADNSRFDILCCLAEKDMYGKELSEKLGLSPTTISQHLNKLVSVGLINANLHSRYIYYSLNKERFKKIIGGLSDLFLQG